MNFGIEGWAAGWGAVKDVFASSGVFACFCHTKFWSWSIPWPCYAIVVCICRKYLWLEHGHGKQVTHRHTEATTKKKNSTQAFRSSVFACMFSVRYIWRNVYPEGLSLASVRRNQ